MLPLSDASAGSETTTSATSESPIAELIPNLAVSEPNLPEPEPRDPWTALECLLAGLVAVLALAAIGSAFREAHVGRVRDQVIKDLTTAAAAVQDYMRAQNAAPPDTVAGVVPPGMGSLLAKVNWTSPTPGGGHYRLVNVAPSKSDGTTPMAVILAITAFPPSPAFTLSNADLRAIDRRIDDGNLATGNFRTGFHGWPFLWVRASR